MKQFIVKRSRFELFTGLFFGIGMAIFIVVLTIFPRGVPPLWFYLFFGSAFILCISLVLLWIMWRIEVHGDKIYYRNMFGRSKTFTFDMIGKVIRKRRDMGYYVADKMIIYSKERQVIMRVEGSGISYALFIARLIQEGITITENKPPEVNKWKNL